MLGCSTGAFAQSADDDEDVPADTRIIRQFLKDFGLRRDGEPGIDYRERAPLVVPPSRTLPPPRNPDAVSANPAWPKDPDVTQRRVEAARKKAIAKTAAEATVEDGRPLRPSELERGRVPPGSVTTATPTSPEESARPSRPSELRGKSLFSGMFSSFSDKGEAGEFISEPPRTDLTAPPPGYQTPSPAQPYGVGSTKERAKNPTIEDRMTGYGR
jgi:hypothetical protein